MLQRRFTGFRESIIKLFRRTRFIEIGPEREDPSGMGNADSVDEFVVEARDGAFKVIFAFENVLIGQDEIGTNENARTESFAAGCFDATNCLGAIERAG